MKYLSRFSFLFISLFIAVNIYAQPISSSILNKQWPASWISVPEQGSNTYGVYLFRKSIELANKPASFVIHVSADNRDRKSTRLNSSHTVISYAVFCLKKKKTETKIRS